MNGEPASPSIWRSIYDLLGSYGLACVVMILMLLLTLFGTIGEKYYGLYEVQKNYFASWGFLAPLPGGLRLPLPGGELLMAVFSVNLIIGGFLRRMRWRWNNAGLLIVHGGILFLLLSALITHYMGIDGQMTLAEGQTSNRFQSYTEWDMTVVDPRQIDKDLLYRVPAASIQAASAGKPQTFSFAALPIDVIVDSYYPNCRPLPKGPMFTAPTPVIDGFFLQPMTLDPQAEQNIPGAYVTIRDRKSGATTQGILFGASDAPLVEKMDGADWRIDLERRTWTLPFSITLSKFTHEYYPGTNTAKVYMSDVIKTESGVQQPIKISMNEPLRHEGYTFFQASFGEKPVLTSTFAVVRNPADQWPLYSLLLIGVGMLIHFSMRLGRYLRTNRESVA